MHKWLYQLQMTLLFGLFTLPIWPRMVGSVLIGAFTLVGLATFLLDKKASFRWGYFILSVLLYVMYAVSMIYTTEVSYGLKKMSTGLPLLLIPLTFATFTNHHIVYCKKYLKDFLKLYVLAVGVLICSSTYFLLSEYNWELFIAGERSFLHRLQVWNGMDMLYVSLHVSLALVAITYLFYISKKWWKALIAIGIAGFLFAVLIYLSFKASIVAFLVGAGAMAFLINKPKMWSFFASGLVTVTALIMFSPSMNQKFSELLVLKDQSDRTIQSLEIRDIINECSFEIMPNAGLLGYGIGDGKSALLDCFKDKNSTLFNASYNTHNQYLSIVLNVGFIGLLLFLFTIGIHTVISLNKGGYLAVAVTLFFAVWMLAENILERQDGVMYLSLFLNALYILNFYSGKPKKMVLSHEKIIDALHQD